MLGEEVFMGLLGYIQQAVRNFNCNQKLKEREICDCDGRLKKFIENHTGEVINGSIPISCHHIGAGYTNSGNAVEYYVRIEYLDGRTKFEWFDNFTDGNLYKSKIIQSGDYEKLIGPASIYGAFD